MPVEESPFRAEPVDPARYREASRATWISAGLNLALTVVQLIVGWLAPSSRLTQASSAAWASLFQMPSVKP